MNYCNRCKKSLDNCNFDKKKNGELYTRCKICRDKHNKHESKKYVKKKCSRKTMCDDNCKTCFERSFASYDGKTDNGKLKIDCWIEEKNGKTPREVTKKNSNKYWFKCDKCYHEFNSRLSNVTILGNWCSFCSNLKLCNDMSCQICLDKSFAIYKGKTQDGILKIDCWDKEKNNKLMPRDVFKNTHKKYFFKCTICKHSFNLQLNCVSLRNYWCFYCAKPSRKLCSDENCKFCFKRSFASFDGKTHNGKLKIDCWNKTKNNNLTPRDVFKSSGKKYYFNCDVCKHEFKNKPISITTNKNWCIYCSGQKLCDNKKCHDCFIKSFDSYYGKTPSGNFKKDCLISDKKNK